MKLLLPLIAASLLAGCMSTEQMSPREPVADREYPTGTSFPRRTTNSSSGSGVTTMDRDAAERARESAISPSQMPGAPKGP